MSSCKVRELALTGLANENAIDRESGEILDFSVFNKLNEDYTTLVKEKYNVGNGDTTLFATKVEGKKEIVEPNNILFPILEEAITNHNKDKKRWEKTTEFDEKFKRDWDEIVSENADKLFNDVEEEIGDIKRDPKEIKLHDFSSIGEKATYTVRIMTQNLGQALAKSRKSKNKTQYTEVFQANIKDLIAQMEELEGAQDWQAIMLYVKRLKRVVSNIEDSMKDLDENSSTVFEDLERIDNYLSTFDMLPEIENLLSSALRKAKKDELPKVAVGTIEEIRDELDTFKGKHSRLLEDASNIKNEKLIEYLADSKIQTSVETEWRNRFEAEYRKAGITSVDKGAWIAKKMNEYSEEIEKDLIKGAKRLVHNQEYDLDDIVRETADPLNTNNKLFQLAVNMVADSRNKINERVLSYEFALDNLYQKVKKKHGASTPEKMYGHLVEFDSDGKGYVKGKYKLEFLEKFRNEYLALKKEQAIVRDEILELGGTEADFVNDKKYKELETKITQWRLANLKGRVPSDEWRNDLSHLSTTDREVLTTYWDTIEQTSEMMDHRASLRTKAFGASFYALPSVSKKETERLFSLDAKGYLKDKKDDLTKIRVDDTSYQSEATDSKGNELKQLKIHYRGKIDQNQQSIDLLTLMRMEVQNGVNYDERSMIEGKLKVLLNVVKDKEFIVKSKKTNKDLFSFFRSKEPRVVKRKGEDSNLFKRLQGYIESSIYDELHKNAGSILGADKNKIIQTINGTTAFIGMSVNIASGVANITNGFSQLFIESMGGNHISWNSLVKAEKKYAADLPKIMNDLGSPVKKSFTNQVVQMFDTYGGFSVTNHEFFKNNILKSMSSLEILSGIQNGGEHMLQGILTMAVLDNLKVMNSKREYIDSKGNVVKQDKAASLLDMLKRDEKGQLKMDEKVAFTKHNLVDNFHEGGKAHVDLLIKKKIHDTMGAYDPNFQNELYRTWYGKLVMMFKRFLIPGLQARWKGISYSHIDREDLNDEQQMYSTALKEYEEGTYTTFARTVGAPQFFSNMFKGKVMEALNTVKYAHLKENYEALSDYQRANLKKATTELVFTSVLLPVISYFLAAELEDDDESEWLWFMAYQSRRLMSELKQYRALDEAWRITTNPIAGTRIIQNSIDLASSLINPFEWDEENSRGENQLKNDLKKVTPIWVQLSKEWKQSYNFINNQAN